ncbi:MAG: substrate-binding domain-containing protein [Pseudonocardia sp.]|nr:substrate-binding domain-containing protein [Pseudonocardia sp.]
MTGPPGCSTRGLRGSGLRPARSLRRSADDRWTRLRRDRRRQGRTGEHLAALGHRRIGVLTSRLLADGHEGATDAERLTRATFRLFRERIFGLRAALLAAGIDVETLLVEEVPNDPAAGRRGAARPLARDGGITAIAALTDRLALGGLLACHDAGIAVPDQLSVVGFDGTVEAAAATPALTTVAQPFRRKGVTAGSALVDLLAGSAPRVEMLPVELRLGGSTAPRVIRRRSGGRSNDSGPSRSSTGSPTPDVQGPCSASNAASTATRRSSTT